MNRAHIDRPHLLNHLIQSKHNGFVKILTGVRRCGKSYLLVNLFKGHLLEAGISPNHIIEVNLESNACENLRRPDRLAEHLRKAIIHDKRWTYVLIDEIQLCKPYLPDGIDLSRYRPEDRADCYVKFYGVLSELKDMPYVDVYVTGSNSKLLISDVATEFRGRGQTIAVTPLSYAEFSALRQSERNPFTTIHEYMVYGGLPACVLLSTPEEKKSYLTDLYRTIYIRDVIERYKIRDTALLEHVLDIAMSTIGCFTNPTRLANAIETETGIKTNRTTVAENLNRFEQAFLLSKARRYDVKGRHYLDYPQKIYSVDTGLRNARINFRQDEPTHLMENLIYNELLRCGYAVDVGVVRCETRASGKHEMKQHEIDFVVNAMPKQIYIQSAYSLPTEENRNQETFSLRHTGDSFKKVVITNDPFQSRTYDNDGIAYMSLIDFLLDPKSIETL